MFGNAFDGADGTAMEGHLLIAILDVCRHAVLVGIILHLEFRALKLENANHLVRNPRLQYAPQGSVSTREQYGPRVQCALGVKTGKSPVSPKLARVPQEGGRVQGWASVC